MRAVWVNQVTRGNGRNAQFLQKSSVRVQRSLHHDVLVRDQVQDHLGEESVSPSQHTAPPDGAGAGRTGHWEPSLGINSRPTPVTMTHVNTTERDGTHAVGRTSPLRSLTDGPGDGRRGLGPDRLQPALHKRHASHSTSCAGEAMAARDSDVALVSHLERQQALGWLFPPTGPAPAGLHRPKVH